MNILITGCAGFIGYHLSKRLINDGHNILGIDNMNNYYDIKLKQNRLKLLQNNKTFKFDQIDLNNSSGLKKAFNSFKPKRVGFIGFMKQNEYPKVSVCSVPFDRPQNNKIFNKRVAYVVQEVHI